MRAGRLRSGTAWLLTRSSIVAGGALLAAGVTSADDVQPFGAVHGLSGQKRGCRARNGAALDEEPLGNQNGCMPSITLKNLSDELLTELRAAAERDRRSLTQEIIHLLETALRGRPKTVEEPDVKAQVAAWRKLAGKWESNVDAATEAASITKSRTRGREVDL